jgi:Mycothiol maleylpyruvate isomerase N-terminal domain
MNPLTPLTPVFTEGLFPGLHAELISLLRGLAPADWERPTVAGAWRVREVAAHLLDVSLRKLSGQRDGHRPPPPAEPIDSYASLVRFLNRLNADWVRAAGRLSPRLLTDLLDWTGPQVAAFVASVPPHAEAPIGVAWAGEERSENWFDNGREYTEHWHHQEQIREAVGAPPLDGRRWLHPVLDLAVRALPVSFRPLEAPEGTALVLEVTGAAGGLWSLLRSGEAWELWRGEASPAAARARMNAGDAWRLLFNALPPEEARRRIETLGDAALIEPLLAARGVMV